MGAVLLVILKERVIFDKRLLRDLFQAPDLTMWMRITAAHHFALVLEYLHIVHSIITAIDIHQRLLHI